MFILYEESCIIKKKKNKVLKNTRFLKIKELRQCPTLPCGKYTRIVTSGVHSIDRMKLVVVKLVVFNIICILCKKNIWL